MTLDILLPTFNRAHLVARTLDSLLRANRPPDLAVTIYVIDNNSADNTRKVVGEYQARSANIHYLLEVEQGVSAALNSGIRAGTSELIAVLNDDEEIDPHWLEVIQKFFAETSFDFASGPYQPNWSQPKPDWITREFGAIVGWVDGGEIPREYRPEFNAMPMGGNAVFRRRIFEKVGLYNVALGRFAQGLGCCEDEELFRRILAANFRGMYLPDLIIYHYVPPERMTRAYHRRWCWDRGCSSGLLARGLKSNVPELFGLPRWEIRRAAIGALTALKGILGLAPDSAAFHGELYLRDLLGFAYGKFFRRAPSPQPTDLPRARTPEPAR